MTVMLIERRVVRIDRSPMTPKRWCFTLECGHEIWQTWSRKPTRHIMACDACLASDKAREISDAGREAVARAARRSR